MRDSERLAAARGDRRALARLITDVENGIPAPAAPPQAQVVGITGAPGVGKSSLTSALIAAVRARGKTVAVLAVDPSSPFSGGAILGDRVRMQEHSGDAGVYIRSMAARGHLGGLAASTPAVVRLLDAVGFDVIIIETVGVGQSEVDIAAAADTTVVLVAPGMGDGIQAVKAGIVEIADVFVVNKADRDDADAAVRDLRQALSLGHTDADQPSWVPPIIKTISTRGEGVTEVLSALDSHRAWLEASGQLQRRRTHRAEDEIRGLLLVALKSRLDHGELSTAAEQVADGRATAHDAVNQLLNSLLG